MWAQGTKRQFINKEAQKLTSVKKNTQKHWQSGKSKVILQILQNSTNILETLDSNVKKLDSALFITDLGVQKHSYPMLVEM